MKAQSRGLVAIGWREWIMLPGLGIPAIRAKIDTGARTSSLHALEIDPYTSGGAPMVRFRVQPLRRNPLAVFDCDTAVIDRRTVTDSGGHRERRYVILSEIALAGKTWPVEITLSNREVMTFKMLLGRTALAGRCTVDPSRSYLAGKKPASAR